MRTISEHPALVWVKLGKPTSGWAVKPVPWNRWSCGPRCCSGWSAAELFSQGSIPSWPMRLITSQLGVVPALAIATLHSGWGSVKLNRFIHSVSSEWQQLYPNQLLFSFLMTWTIIVVNRLAKKVMLGESRLCSAVHTQMFSPTVLYSFWKHFSNAFCVPGSVLSWPGI